MWSCPECGYYKYSVNIEDLQTVFPTWVCPICGWSKAKDLEKKESEENE